MVVRALKAAERQDLAREVKSADEMRQVLKRLGVGWKRAKHWITSPDPDYARNKRPGTG